MTILSRLLLKQYRDMKSLAGVGAARHRMTSKILVYRKKAYRARSILYIEPK